MEKGIRFGCGFLTGFFLLGIALLFFTEARGMPWWYPASMAGGAIIAGLLAVRFGDAFYRGLGALLSWILGVPR